MQPIRVGIVGVGTVAREQHIPSILTNPAYVFAAASSPNSQAAGVPNFPSIQEMLSQVKDLDAVAICTPPQAHYEAAKLALQSGKHVLLEKPPCTSIAQLSHLVALAATEKLSLYQTWHSQHAPGVALVLQLLRQSAGLNCGVRVTWKEDVRLWHPGQTWMWQPGGFGVLDPGINALSILTHLIDEPILPESSILFIPENCDTPIAASVSMRCESGAIIDVELDLRHVGVQTWDIGIQYERRPHQADRPAAANCAWTMFLCCKRLPTCATNTPRSTRDSLIWCEPSVARWMRVPCSWWPTSSCWANA